MSQEIQGKPLTPEELDQEVFFGKNAPKANFGFWSKAAYWKTDEARRLFLNLCPRGRYELPRGFARENSPIQLASKRLEILLERAKKAGELQNENAPLDYIKWAKSKKIDVPEELEKLVLDIAANDGDKSAASPKAAKPLDQRERETFLKIIISMAIEQYAYNPLANKNSATQDIVDSCNYMGFTVDPDTIRNKLKEAKNLLSREALDSLKTE